ncbi:MAG: DUF4347 domain-containing protein [Leptolyngbya sp. SIOISBB]|nr:DUF4347 domain-containing protein [Leptolyngbya sp. SIOISBB]
MYRNSQRILAVSNRVISIKLARAKLAWSCIFYCTGVITFGVGGLSFNFPAFAQSITSAADGTGTVVTVDGQQLIIEGGSLSGDGANLFHSFDQFDLSSQQTANFITQPEIQNILGRVVGGNPSMIDGLLQVTGGNSNLYVINPGGIIFGPNALLNVSGSFTATTADRIGFEGAWLNSVGDNDYQALIGSPNQFSFLNSQPGAIINAGDLTVDADANLSLIGGTVINIGIIEAPEGDVTLAAIPGDNVVRISQEGRILSLEVPTESLTGGITPTDLPELLTGSSLSGTELEIAADGTAAIGETIIQSGDIVIGGAISGDNVSLNAANQVTPLASETPRVLTRDGAYSAPTVRLFPKSADDATAYVFIDATVPDYETFLYGGQPGTISVVITPEENGITKITGTLHGVTGVDALHILSEGNQGNFWLGNSFVSGDNVEQYSADLQIWGNSLTSLADILIYACFTALGLEGEALVQAISDFTGADVAASTTLTGSPALGGDWVLEASTGNIESGLAFRQASLNAYEDTLAVITVTSNLDNTLPDGQVTLREAINAANNDADGLDTMATGIFGDDEIRFAASMTINLGGTELAINDNAGNLTIDGQANQVIVDGSATSTVFEINNSGGNADVSFRNLTIQNGNVGGNGGGILNSSNAATVTLENATVAGNTATNGGGIYSQNGNVTLINSTISGNVATSNGGGIVASGGTITNSTITNNTAGDVGAGNGGGVYSAASITVQNSIIAGNFDNNGVQNPDVSGTFVDNGNNLIGISEGSANFTTSTLVGTSANPVDPVLAPLGDYGGSTQTHVPLPGSPAIDAGADIAAVTTDQRGQPRANGAYDIGADEVSADLAVSQTVSNANPSPGDSVTFTILVTNNGNDAVGDVSLNNLLPVGLTLTGVIPSSGNYNPSTGDWTIGDLDGNFDLIPEGATASLSLTATVDSNASGTLTNTVQNLNGLGADPNLVDNSVVAEIAIDAASTPPPPDLSDPLAGTEIASTTSVESLEALCSPRALPAGGENLYRLIDIRVVGNRGRAYTFTCHLPLSDFNDWETLRDEFLLDTQ